MIYNSIWSLILVPREWLAGLRNKKLRWKHHVDIKNQRKKRPTLRFVCYQHLSPTTNCNMLSIAYAHTTSARCRIYPCWLSQGYSRLSDAIVVVVVDASAALVENVCCCNCWYYLYTRRQSEMVELLDDSTSSWIKLFNMIWPLILMLRDWLCSMVT